MTDREKAIVMARTGICMLKGEKLDLFYQYLEELFGRPVYTHELITLQSEIEKRSNADFIKICRDEQSEQWIPVSERLPEHEQYVLVTDSDGDVEIASLELIWEGGNEDYGWWWLQDFGRIEVTAWMPLPEPWKGEEDE